MNIVLCLSHAIEEYDQLRLLTGLGYNAFSIGGYIDPAHPHDPKRPALPDVTFYPELKAAVDRLDTPDNLGAAQAWLPDAVLDWADVIIYHHHLDRLFGQWARVKGKRVVWRTVGQSVEGNEHQAHQFRREGLQIVRYSPKERNIPGYAGEDALIRFYKDPAEWQGWTGDDETVIQFVQDFANRWEWCNRPFFEQAIEELPHRVYGPQSEMLPYGGGLLSPEDQKARLRSARAYLYTGTQPASYTLGLIEAMMTGIPVVSIGPSWMRIFPYGPELFEGRDLAFRGSDDPKVVRGILARLLEHADPNPPERQRAIELFGMDTIGRQWREFLGSSVQAEPMLVGAAA